MCGVPFHAAETYINRLVKKGYKVAVAEQMEDPKLANGACETRGYTRCDPRNRHGSRGA